MTPQLERWMALMGTLEHTVSMVRFAARDVVANGGTPVMPVPREATPPRQNEDASVASRGESLLRQEEASPPQEVVSDPGAAVWKTNWGGWSWSTGWSGGWKAQS